MDDSISAEKRGGGTLRSRKLNFTALFSMIVVAMLCIPMCFISIGESETTTNEVETDGGITWEITEDDPSQLIIGVADDPEEGYEKGEMKDYAYSGPWTEYTESDCQLIIKDGVTKIGDRAFFECVDFTGEIHIPTTVKSIGKRAFAGCNGTSFDVTGSDYFSVDSTKLMLMDKDGKNLIGCLTSINTDITIPASVERIGERVFYQCMSLAGCNIIFNANLKSIGVGAFSLCNATGFNLNGNTNFSVTDNNVILMDGDGKTLISCLRSKTGALTIPETVVTIGDEAFIGCNKITGNLVIPNSVVRIGDRAFYRWDHFAGTLTLGNSIETIGDYAFNEGQFTGNLVIPNSVVRIGDYAFYYCDKLTGSINIGDNVTYLGEYAFAACKGFNGTISIGDGVTTIREHTFDECNNLSGTLKISDNVVTIEKYAFSYCAKLTSLILGKNIVTIGEQAFENCKGLTGSLVIGDKVTTIGSGAFKQCTGFDGTLTLGNSVELIRDSAFTNCTFNGVLKIPDSVKIIEEGAFDDCKGFTGLALGNGVVYFGKWAFNRCTGMTGTLEIPYCTTAIETDAFNYCNFDKITIYSADCYIDNYAFGECVFHDKDGKELKTTSENLDGWEYRLESKGNYIRDHEVRTIVICTNNAEWGTIDGSSTKVINVAKGTEYTVDGNKLIINGQTYTATPTDDDKCSFVTWSCASGTVEENSTVYAVFSDGSIPQPEPVSDDIGNNVLLLVVIVAFIAMVALVAGIAIRQWR